MRKTPTATAKTVPAIDTVEYELFHSIDDFFNTALEFGRGGASKKEIRKAFHEGKYRHVYTFDRPSEPLKRQLEKIFDDSQNFDEAWNPDSVCRSTSVGDLVKVNGTFYIVASVGFDKVWKE